MREIKFRAWDGMRITTSGIMFNSSTGALVSAGGMPIMQYTGLKDKNGKEIYEGDVLQLANLCGVVEYNQARFMQRIKGILEPIWITCEIIGNIYENPELQEEHNG